MFNMLFTVKVINLQAKE